MARDYKRRAPARKKKVAPGWVWLLAGLAVGLFVAFLVYLNEQPSKAQTGRAAHAPRPAPTETRKEAAAKPAPTPKPQVAPEKKPLQYDFYTILPQFEVEVPEEKNPPREKPVAALETPGTYVLQVGSFKQARDAEARKAELAMLGIVSSVQAVDVDATTYHRVRIGPLQDLDHLNRVRQTLRENGFEFMTLTLKARS
ncbi:MAG: SPOR domain-containing protein [Thiohalomonadaceae bacterium]